MFEIALEPGLQYNQNVPCSNNTSIKQNTLVKEREYYGSNMFHSSTVSHSIFKECTRLLLRELPKYIVTYGIKTKLQALL